MFQLNTGQTSGPAGLDINVEPVWMQGYTGTGVVVGFVDDGTHCCVPTRGQVVLSEFVMCSTTYNGIVVLPFNWPVNMSEAVVSLMMEKCHLPCSKFESY